MILILTPALSQQQVSKRPFLPAQIALCWHLHVERQNPAQTPSDRETSRAIPSFFARSYDPETALPKSVPHRPNSEQSTRRPIYTYSHQHLTVLSSQAVEIAKSKNRSLPKPSTPLPPTSPMNERGLPARVTPWSAPATAAQQNRLRHCRLTTWTPTRSL